MNVLPVLDAVLTRLREKLPQLQVEYFPEKPAEYRLNHPVTILDIPGVENLFNTQKTNDPIDCTRSKARKLADLIEAWEPPDHWFTGIGKSEGKALLIAFLRNCKGFRTH